MPFEIKHPITGCILQVAEEDFPSAMNWDDAVAACQNLGNGWRLPTKEELLAMYEQLHEHGKGNFEGSKDYMLAWYWSSSQHESDYAWFINFGYYGDVSGIYKYYDARVRAVRDLP